MEVTSGILQKEFIGIDAKVQQSVNSSLLGISGTVVDETRNTLVIRHKNRDKKIVKDIVVFRFNLQDQTIVEIDGRTMVGRPEDRVKRKVRRYW